MIATERFEKVEITSLDALRDWLASNHGLGESVWLVRYKENVPGKHVGRLAVFHELLCFGWVNGLGRKLDADRAKRQETRTKRLLEVLARSTCSERVAQI